MFSKKPNSKQNIKISFSTKVLLYALSVSTISLLLAGLSFITYDIKETRQGLVATSELQADMIANYSIEALVSKNKDLAYEMIDAIGSDRYVKGAWVYDNQNELFSSYDPTQIGPVRLPETFKTPGAFFDENELTVVRAIQVGPKILGTIVIKSTLDGIYTRTIYQVTTVIVVMFISLCGAMLLSFRFQRSLTSPLRTLLGALERVTQTNDYSLRAQKVSNDDLGVLTDAFNNMLGEVDGKTQALKHSEERLHLALWGSNEVLFDWDLLSDQLYFDNAIEQLLGFSIHTAPKTLDEYIQILHPNDIDGFEKALSDHLKGHNAHFEAEYRIKNSQGDYRWVLTRGKVVDRNKKGLPQRLTGTFGDITNRKEAEEELNLFHKVFSSTTEGVVVTDTQLRIIQCNNAFSHITGYMLEEIKGKSIECLYSDKHPISFYNNIRYDLENEGKWMGELTQKRKSGEDYPSHLSVNAMLDDKEQLIHYVGVFSDLTATKKKDEKLIYLSHFDPLTNIPNRALLKKALVKTIDLAGEAKTSFGLIIVGLDNFKIINDTFGHVVGDELLKQVASRLIDLVDTKEHIARLGGDEFALIVENIHSPNKLKDKASDILQVMTQKFIIDHHEIIMGCCIGISVYPHDGQDMDTLLMNADTAMLHAKRDQTNTFKFFIQSMNEQVLERQQLESLLRKAIERDELKLYYQPKVDAKTGKIVGAEALLRWLSNERGMIGPDKFIPLAEETGLIVPIGEWVLRQACMQGKLWHNAGWDNFTMAVNVSGIQFKRENYLDSVQKILHETGYSPDMLDLEITEGALMANTDHCIFLLKMLGALGITISIDDFGTGYSSLSYLRKFPIHTLKIDQSFVRKMMANREDAHIIAAVLDIAQGLKLKTVAEGVETIEQLETLRKMGCDVIQGYYYSKPLPANEFEAFYQQQSQDKDQDKEVS